MSILRYKQKVMFADGGVLRDSGGGGGAAGPSTTYNTNIPEYAKPYVTNMLGATQRQLFTTGGGQAARPATYDTQGNELTPAVEATPDQITGFKPYQPYSANVNDYFAGPSPLQLQSYQAASQLQTPQQIMEGSQMAAQGGQGLMGTALPAMGISGMAAGAGQAYENQATNAADVARYMSPYMQNVVNYQKSQALRDYQMAQPMMQAKAAGQGAFGGNRLALQQAEAQRGLMSQLQGIEATGAQTAFDKAQAAQQYRANLGLQGFQTGLQGIGAAQAGLSGGVGAGSALGNLGQQQLGAQTGIINLQNQLGTQQQQMEQAKINQAIQDYATAQQYPMMQLGFMSNMLRGLPLQATTTQSYQATPGLYQQGIGAIGTLAGAKQAGLFKEGGVIKGLAGGGAIRYADTGAVEANPESGVTRGVQAQLARMDENQLRQVAATSPSEEVRAMANEMIAQKEIEKQAEQRAQQSMPQQAPMPSQGIAAAPAPSMDGMAGGGIIAFADRGQVEDPFAIPSDEEAITRQQRLRELAGITGKPQERYGKYIDEQIAKQGDAESQMKGYNLMGLAARFGTTTGGPLYAAQKAVEGELPDIIKRQEAYKSREGQLMKGQAEIENADRLEKAGFVKAAEDEREKGLARLKDLKVANIHAAASAAAANRPTDLDRTTKAIFDDLVAKGADPKNPATSAQARKQAIEMTGMSGARADVAAQQAITNALAKDKTLESLNTQLLIADDKDKPAIQKQIADREAQIRSSLGFDRGAVAAAPAPGGNAPVVYDGYQFPSQEAADKYKKAKENKKG